MLTSITPLGERGRASRWAVTVTAYVIGSGVGGLAVGFLGGAVGALLPLEQRPYGVVAVAVLALAAVLALLAGSPAKLETDGPSPVAPHPARARGAGWRMR